MSRAPRRAGVDAGATLTKIARAGADGPELFAIPSERTDETVARLADLDEVACTGGNGSRLAARLDVRTRAVPEFEAWRRGVRRLLGDVAAERYLVATVGTGTSILLVEGDRVTRLAGTPLGGGTVLGLGGALAGTSDFEALCELARRGDRSRVDLSVADIYDASEAPLATDVVAAAFARLPDGPHRAETPARPEDLARSVMAMVGENVALLAGSLSLVARVEQIVAGGSTLQGNPTLTDALADYVGRFGRKLHVLEDGGFAGALGALSCLESEPAAA